MIAKALFLSLLLLAPAASAIELAGRDLLIPVLGRVAGAGGSMWQSDVTITNLTDAYARLALELEFNDGARVLKRQLELDARATVTLQDIVRTTFGSDSAFGTLRVRAPVSDARIVARAWIYNTAADRAGRFGQNVQGLPVEQLAKTTVLTGLTAEDGKRTNVGISNPGPDSATVKLIIPPAPVADKTITLPPGGGVQLDLLSIRGGARGSTVSELHVVSDVPVYSYASIVDAGGDPIFVIGSAFSQAAPLTPSCASPAPFADDRGVNGAPGYFVALQAGVDAEAFAAEKGITPLRIFSFINSIFAELTPELIAAIRCDSRVLFVEQNSVGFVL